MSDRSNDSLSFLAGGLIGAAVGAVIGLLFAPTSGEQTRKKLKKQTTDLAKEVNKTIKTIEKEQIRPRIDDATKYVQGQIDDAKDFAQDKMKDAKKTIKMIDREKDKQLNNARDYAEDKMNDVKKAVNKTMDDTKKSVDRLTK